MVGLNRFYMGGHSRPSKQCLRFLFIVKRSGVDDIAALLNDSSACIRVYAYSYLRSLDYKNLKKVKLMFQKDSSEVFFMSDCGGGKAQVRSVVKSIKHWETEGRFEKWFKDYSEHESYWRGFLMAE